MSGWTKEMRAKLSKSMKESYAKRKHEASAKAVPKHEQLPASFEAPVIDARVLEIMSRRAPVQNDNIDQLAAIIVAVWRKL